MGLLGSIGGLESVRALPPAVQIQAVRGIAATGEAVDRTGSAVSNWARNNPNTAEGIKAAANIGGVAFGAVKGISHVRNNYEFGGIGGNAIKNSQRGAVGIFGKKNPYSHLLDKNSVGEGKRFTAAQKKAIIQENMNRHGGVVKSDQSGTVLVRPQKSQKGVSPPSNEWQIDHIKAKSKGGTNSYKNAQVLSRRENAKKSNK